MDTNLDQISEHLFQIFKNVDFDESGLIAISDARGSILTSKKLTLSPFQTNILIGLSNPDDKG